jgi:hypothetical protein
MDEPPEGAELAELVIVTGLGLPMAHPQTGQQMIVPDGQYVVPLQKETVAALIEQLQKAYDKLPEPKPQSNLVVPGNPQDVDRIANDLNRFKG